MSRQGEYPLVANEATLATLRALFDANAGTHEVTKHALSLGLKPPADGPDWNVVIEFDPTGEEVGLFWDGPDDD